MDNTRPKELTNGKMIREYSTSFSRIPMVRYEEIVEYYIKEPAKIIVVSESNKIKCELIFQVVREIPNSDLISFSIYSDEREEFDENTFFIIRKVYWNKKVDIAGIREGVKEREELLNTYPSIENNNILVSNNPKIIRMLKQLDNLVSDGIVLSDEINPDWSGANQLRVMRCFDWGIIESLWGKQKKNIELEKFLHESIEKLNDIILNEKPTDFEIDLDYLYSPDSLKSIINGSIVK
ncbi:hypothetical protein [Enterococcus caccae]|uniref:Uncharacterized protein n=1 Tax=Enterococcus caccae ATCC BAA-1240 TaxID=1158612 RepID=R3WE44_9ENTE|nr:hypothetical protein [Enterococcus caccae]EOL45727.1 hypothetical protein UC7_01524 [Enterococcus caccae ATCC BAA-1240]EOT60923.1 hypothetical protein I580_01825 [Enterococcus caccae ATCC BAA-1240]OJG21556.1 hypothetical protein RU98_GL002449 [Enterococcus caccae]